MKKTSLVLAGLICLFVGGSLRAQQVDLLYATYGTDTPATGAAPVSGVTNTLGPITVTQIYTNSTGTYTFNFVSDSSGVSNYIYYPISSGNPDPFVAGSTYTGLSLTSSPFGTPANLELTVSSGTTVPAPTATGFAGMYSVVSESALTTTSTFTDNYTPQTSTAPSDLEPVQFTYTASENKTVTPITGNYKGTDASNSDIIDFYRPTNGLTFVSGQTYTIDGYAFAFSTGVEIYDPSIVAVPVPEPSCMAFLGLGGLTIVLSAVKARAARRA